MKTFKELKRNQKHGKTLYTFNAKLFVGALLIAAIGVAIYSWRTLRATIPEGATIYVVPVYGQSLALGEEATMTTNLDSLKAVHGDRIVGSELNGELGYFSSTIFKQRMKMLLHDRHRSFETSCLMLAATMLDSLNAWGDQRSVVCSFEAGQGETAIDGMAQGTECYEKFLQQLRNIAENASSKHCRVVMPAFCWVQGENDLVWSSQEGYGEKLKRFRMLLEKDVNKIFGTNSTLHCILYQTSCLSIARDGYQPLAFDCRQVSVPEQQRQLIVSDSLFIASTPVYPFTVMRDYVHIDGEGQRKLGRYEGRAVANLMKNNIKETGLQPMRISLEDDNIILKLNNSSPLQIDTSSVMPIANYGFSVITPHDKDILQSVSLADGKLVLKCSSSPQGCKLRYGVTGTKGKSGRKSGPRGNIRDSNPLSNWLYIFDMAI